MSEITHIIRARTVEKLRKEAKELKKTLKIPHHQALDLAARKADFNDWEHLQKSAVETSISEEPYRNGFVFAMDVKDADNHKVKSNLIILDENVFALIFMDFMSERGYSDISELSEYETFYLEDLEINYIYFRYAGQTPKTRENALNITQNEFFFPPRYTWLKGTCYDMFGKFDFDEYIKELINDE